MPPSRNNAIKLYVTAVVAFAFVAAFLTSRQTDFAEPFGPRPQIFAVFALLLALGEARPIKWATAREEIEITASWTFSLGLVCVAPTLIAMVTAGTV